MTSQHVNRKRKASQMLASDDEHSSEKLNDHAASSQPNSQQPKKQRKISTQQAKDASTLLCLANAMAEDDPLLIRVVAIHAEDSKNLCLFVVDKAQATGTVMITQEAAARYLASVDGKEPVIRAGQCYFCIKCSPWEKRNDAEHPWFWCITENTVVHHSKNANIIEMPAAAIVSAKDIETLSSGTLCSFSGAILEIEAEEQRFSQEYLHIGVVDSLSRIVVNVRIPQTVWSAAKFQLYEGIQLKNVNVDDTKDMHRILAFSTISEASRIDLSGSRLDNMEGNGYSYFTRLTPWFLPTHVSFFECVRHLGDGQNARLKATGVNLAYDPKLTRISYVGCKECKRAKACMCRNSAKIALFKVIISIWVPGEPPISAIMFDKIATKLIKCSANELFLKKLKERKKDRFLPKYQAFLHDCLCRTGVNLTVECSKNQLRITNVDGLDEAEKNGENDNEKEGDRSRSETAGEDAHGGTSTSFTPTDDSPYSVGEEEEAPNNENQPLVIQDGEVDDDDDDAGTEIRLLSKEQQLQSARMNHPHEFNADEEAMQMDHDGERDEMPPATSSQGSSSSSTAGFSSVGNKTPSMKDIIDEKAKARNLRDRLGKLKAANTLPLTQPTKQQ